MRRGRPLAGRGPARASAARVGPRRTGELAPRVAGGYAVDVQIVTEEACLRELGCLDRPEVRVVASGNFATPRRLLGLIDEALPSYRLFMLNAQGPLPDREGVIYETPFIGPGMRGAGARCDYLPMRLSLVPQLFERSRPPDIVAVHTSMPVDGRVSLGIEVNILVAALEYVRDRGGLVVAQMNPGMPYTFGDGEIDVGAIDLAVVVEEELSSPVPRPPGETARAIAEQVADLAGDGSTLQLGIGAVPDATLASLTARRGLGIWSEMFSDGVLALERSGALDPGRPLTASFLFGSADLYRWVDRNPRVRMLRTETTNDPSRIAQQPAMTSINTALEVDLFAQANASYVGGRPYSGFGGQSDFTVGAMHARGGRAVIALPSWHDKTGRSTIVAALSTPVTSFQHSVIASEHGRAHIFGRSLRAQRQLLIDQVAHPDAREGLRDAAPAAGSQADVAAR